MQLAGRMERLGTESAFDVLIRANAMEATGRKVIHLELGEPDFATPEPISEAAAGLVPARVAHDTAFSYLLAAQLKLGLHQNQ